MNKKTVVGVVLFLAIVLLAVGFAAITAVNLVITGNTTATPSQENFKVVFTGEPETSEPGKVTADINEDDPTKATMDVSGLTAKDQFVTATFTIQNKSADLSAQLTEVSAVNTNTAYFKVDTNIAEPTLVTAGSTTTVTVTVTLLKTPISGDETGTTTVTLKADPVQP